MILTFNLSGSSSGAPQRARAGDGGERPAALPPERDESIAYAVGPIAVLLRAAHGGSQPGHRPRGEETPPDAA